MRCSLAIFGTAAAARSLRAAGENIISDGSTEVWVPIHPDGGAIFYFNPVTGESARSLRRGVAAAVQVSAEPAANRTGGTLVPLKQRLSCVPHCAWQCTEPVCEQNCHPECGVPACETRCPKLGAQASMLAACKVRCGEPNCAMFCPPDPCNGKKSLECSTPKCSTKCERPKCMLDCPPASLGCKTVCPTPQCQWKCAKPVSCPTPQCSMHCEMAPDCASNAISVPPPALEPWQEVVGRKAAARGVNAWQSTQWSACTTRCGAGAQTRRVECSAGADYCTGPRPASQQPCEDYSGCRFEVGPWSACSARCGAGVRSRSVKCDGRHCAGDKPEEREQCTGHEPTCSECRVTLWGGRGFQGWERTFEAGEYSSTELEFRGIKCDDISSLEVVGDFCQVEVYEFGDFNSVHSGWSATFPMGKYNTSDLEAKGAHNNDISSFKVRRLHQDASWAGPEAPREFHGGDSHAAAANGTQWRDPFKSGAVLGSLAAVVAVGVLL